MEKLINPQVKPIEGCQKSNEGRLLVSNIKFQIRFVFKPHDGTRGAILAVYAIISNSLCDRKRLYSDLFDFRKAFDSIDRSLLWIKLYKIGIQGQFLNVIKALFNNVKSHILWIVG